ncbi:hypothetical protein BHE74_00004553 [Ensete ventricosum]|nr:hypothetical protein BHE74_00004553 [Ensete ventricosum]
MLQIKCWSFTCYFVVPDTFNKHFSNYGEIIDSVIMKDKNTHMPRGFGFVTFADPSVIDRVLEDEHVIDGRTVGISMKLLPHNFLLFKQPPLTNELKEHFSSYGEVIEHQIMLDHSTRRSRGFGFVTFKDEEAVDKIISEGRMHDLAGKQVEIKRAEPKRSSGGSSRMNERVGHGGSNRSARGFRGNSYGYGSDHNHMVMRITVEAQAMVTAEAIPTGVSQAMVQPMGPTTVGLCMELAATVVTCTVVAQVGTVDGLVATAVAEVMGTDTTPMANEKLLCYRRPSRTFIQSLV